MTLTEDQVNKVAFGLSLMMELNQQRIFLSAFKLDVFHKISPLGVSLPPPTSKSDVIRETKTPGKNECEKEEGRLGELEGKSPNGEVDEKCILSHGGDRRDKGKKKTSLKRGRESCN